MRVCSDARVAHTCRSLACVRLFPRDGRCRHCTSFAPPERAGGAYMPPFGMCAAIAHRGPCPHCTSFAAITRRRLRARVAHTCRRLACVRLLRTADDAVIARRSQTSQDDVCATPGKLKEKSERRKSRRVSGKRDSALPQSELPRCALSKVRCREWRATPSDGIHASPYLCKAHGERPEAFVQILAQIKRLN